MANFNYKSPVEQVNRWGASVGLGTSQKAESLGLHDSRPKSLGLSENGIQLDPLSIRITLVIVFVIIFLLVVLVVFLVICLKRHKCIGSSKHRDENGKRLRNTRNRYNTEDDDDFSMPRPRTVSHDSENSFMNDNEDYLHGVSYNSGSADLEKVSKKPYEPRSPQPDIIEAEIHFVPSYHLYDYAYDHRIYGPSNDKIKQQIQCDLPKVPDVNCFRVPPQSLCHSPVSYREHQDAEDVKRRNFIHHSLVLRSHLNNPPSTASPSDMGLIPSRGNAKTELFQTTPLARLTPSTSSESPKHPVRILTLQDISRKQLQSAGLVLESTSSSGGMSKDIVHSHSEVTSWNSPVVSQFSKWSSGPEASTESSGAKNPPPDTVHLDGLHNHDIPPPVQPDDCSVTSTDTDDDSFTGSECIDDDLRQESQIKSRQGERHTEQQNNEPQKTRPSYVLNVETDIFPDAFSKLVSYDSNLAQRSNAQSLNNLEYLLNWGLNFESLMDVFQDLAELPDLEPDDSRNKQNVSSPCEIYV